MRKSTIPSPLKRLTDDQLAEVHSWFKRSTYPEILVRLRDRFGVRMSKTQLCRYFQRFAEAQLFNAVLYTPLTPADMLAIKNAGPIPDPINQEVLKQHCLRLAARPDLRASDLKHLFDVFTYEDRRDQKERGQAIQAQELAMRESFLEYRLQLRAERSNP